MRRFFPFIFLVPVVFLVVCLPLQLRGELPYTVATFTYVENIFMWLLFFVGFMAMSRRVRWTRAIFVFLGVEMVASCAFSLWRGRTGVGTFLTVMVAVGLFMAYVWIMSPPIRQKTEGENE